MKLPMTLLILLALNLLAIFFLIIVIVGLSVESIPATITVGGVTIFGRFLTNFVLNGSDGLVTFVVIILVAEVILLPRAWKGLTGTQSGSPDGLREGAANQTPVTSLLRGRIASVLLLISLFVPTLFYILYFIETYQKQEASSYIPTVLELFLFVSVALDSFWRRTPNERYQVLRLGDHRNRRWLQLNSLFFALSIFDFLVIFLSFTLLAGSHSIPIQSEGGDDFFGVLTVVSLFYLFTIISRNSIFNILGQGYGALPPGEGKVAGDSLIGVAAVASLARALLQENSRLGVRYLRQSAQMLQDWFFERHASLSGLQELSAATKMFGRSGVPVPAVPLELIASHLEGIGSRTDLIKFGELSDSINQTLERVGWRASVVVEPPKRRSAWEILTLVGVVAAGIGVIVQIVANLTLPAGSVGNLVLKSGIEWDLASLVASLVMVAFSLRIVNRLSDTTTDWRLASEIG